MKKQHEQGFSAIEAILVIVILGILGFGGWFVWHAKQNTDKTLSDTQKSSNSTANTPAKQGATPPSTGAYAGWKTLTLKNEKVSFKYPADWTAQDNGDSGHTDQDHWQLQAPDGFVVAVEARPAGGYGGDESKVLSADPVTLAGQKLYLVYESSPIAGSASTFTGKIDSMFLSAVPDQENKYPTAKNNITNSSSFSRTTILSIFADFPSGKGVTTASGNTDIADAKLIIASATY